MLKGVFYLLFTGLLLSGMFVSAAEVEPANAPISQTSTAEVEKPQSAVVTKFKEVFKYNEQKPKKMRSKDIVKTKEKIRRQELLRLQKEKEIKYLERKLKEKQKTLDRLES